MNFIDRDGKNSISSDTYFCKLCNDIGCWTVCRKCYQISFATGYDNNAGYSCDAEYS